MIVLHTMEGFMVTFEEIDRIRQAYRMSKDGFSEFLNITPRTYYQWNIFGIADNSKCHVFLNLLIKNHASLIGDFAEKNLELSSPATR